MTSCEKYVKNGNSDIQFSNIIKDLNDKFIENKIKESISDAELILPTLIYIAFVLIYFPRFIHIAFKCFLIWKIIVYIRNFRRAKQNVLNISFINYDKNEMKKLSSRSYRIRTYDLLRVKQAL